MRWAGEAAARSKLNAPAGLPVSGPVPVERDIPKVYLTADPGPRSRPSSMGTMTSRGRVAFATMAVVWGIPYLLIKVSVDGGFSPLLLAWSRVTVAAAILLALAWRGDVLGGLRGRRRWVAAYAICEMAIPFPMLAFGETRVSSSLAAILIATVPLIIAALAIRFAPSERVAGHRLAGLLLGLAGVVALVGIDVAGSPRELVGAAAIMVT